MGLFRDRGSGPMASERLAQLIRTHQAPLWRYLRFLGCNPTEAEDLIQETFVEVWNRPFAYRGPEAARSYLRRVARNRFLMAARRRQVRPLFTDLDAAEQMFETHLADGGSAYRSALRTCLERLSEKLKHAVQLAYGDRQSRTQIANRLNMTAEGVKTLLRRTRTLLRECVERTVES